MRRSESAVRSSHSLKSLSARGLCVQRRNRRVDLVDRLLKLRDLRRIGSLCLQRIELLLRVGALGLELLELIRIARDGDRQQSNLPDGLGARRRVRSAECDFAKAWVVEGRDVPLPDVEVGEREGRLSIS